MKTLLLFGIFLSCIFSTFCKAENSFLLDTFSDRITFIRMDSVHTSQATIVEYKDFLVVIELPFIDEGGNVSKNLREDSIKAESFLYFTAQRFNGKPIKYILHSHWHLHSLSGITPFLKNGTILFTTQSSWQYSIQNGFVKNAVSQQYNNSLTFVRGDTTILSDTDFPIRLLHLDNSYRFKPTKEYLLFYFPKSFKLHASCLCAVSETELNRKGSIYSDRLTDLQHAIAERNLHVDTIIKLGRYEQKKGNYLPPYFSYKSISQLIENNKPYFSLIKQIADIDTVILTTKRDSLLTNAISRKLPPSMFNQAVYECIRVKEYNKAIIMAHFLNLYFPGETSYIDTMGEAYFAAGDITTATYYDSLLKRKDPKFSGGLVTWEENKKSSSK